MQRGLVHALAWTLATGAAVTLSWFGVHTVLSGTAYDAPRALPLSDQVDVTPRVSSTHRPKPSGPAPSPSPSDEKTATPSAPSRSGNGEASRSPAPPAGSSPTTDGRFKSYATAGGRVVFDMGAGSAELVSATPNSGWEMQVWKQQQWIRVDFTGGAAHTSVICTWNGHPPTVEYSNHAT
ncbi:hypothetical protein [Streptomyces sp. NPDC101150]|uniref:hypothetical protein n=1 Tax=Streptomyces sp. NPDC101150 TaxID=3366114 RepID=UPI0037F96726